MDSAYLVTESATAAAILKKLLPRELVAHTAVIEGSGAYSAGSLATSLLAVKRRPTALVMDAETENELRVREQREFLHEMLHSVAPTVPFGIFIAVPEVEIVLLQDRSVLEQLAGRSFSDAEWVGAQHQPRSFLTTVFGGPPLPVERILGQLTTEQLHALQRYPLIGKIAQFLSEAVGAPTHLAGAGSATP